MEYSGCLFRKLTGLYCPGCGGQRAFRALFVFGDPIRSFLIHPIVLYSVVVFAIYFVSVSIHFISRRRIAMLRFEPALVWIALAMVLVNWVVKNIFILNGIDILKVITPVRYIV